MASGYESVHPKTAAALQELGVTDAQIIQGWGYAAASAGYHDPEGQIDGHAFSSCVDLAYELAGQDFVDRLVDAGMCPFVREQGNGWSGASHIHCVYVGLTDENGQVTILPGPRMQIVDFTQGLNGLVGHAPIACYPPSADQQAAIGVAYAAWAPQVATQVLAPEGNAIACYAFLEQEVVRCEAAAFLGYWGATLVAGTSGPSLAAEYKGAELDLSGARCTIEGDFTRADVRGLAAALHLEAEFGWTEGGDAAEVKVRY
jgi:hypothetical protein